MRELISLPRKRIFNKNSEFKVCPKCEKKELTEKIITDIIHDKIHDWIECQNCGWTSEEDFIFSETKGLIDDIEIDFPVKKAKK